MAETIYDDFADGVEDHGGYKIYLLEDGNQPPRLKYICCEMVNGSENSFQMEDGKIVPAQLDFDTNGVITKITHQVNGLTQDIIDDHTGKLCPAITRYTDDGHTEIIFFDQGDRIERPIGETVFDADGNEILPTVSRFTIDQDHVIVKAENAQKQPLDKNSLALLNQSFRTCLSSKPQGLFGLDQPDIYRPTMDDPQPPFAASAAHCAPKHLPPGGNPQPPIVVKPIPYRRPRPT